jgi:UDP-N-acetylmuramate--alanine ligase
VAGTAGKTTTTAMIAQILLEAESDPTVMVGGVLPTLGSNGRAGQGPHFVVEADEYDHMFLGLRPQMAVVTNVEHDHPDLFPTAELYFAAFRDFVSLVPAGGKLIACVDDEGAARLLRDFVPVGAEPVAYGLADRGAGSEDWSVYQAADLRGNGLGGSDFLVLHRGATLGLARLRVPGQHNVLNALAAVAVGNELGIGFATIRRALADFAGVGRRFELIGEVGDVVVVDDYAHHPAKIRATLAAARQRFPGRRLWAVWQPHTYSRTKALAADFAASFADADVVVALDIYASRERDTLSMDTDAVLAQSDHPNAHHVGGLAEAATFVLERVRPGDVVLTLSAGDGDRVGQMVLAGLRRLANGR